MAVLAPNVMSSLNSSYLVSALQLNLQSVAMTGVLELPALDAVGCSVKRKFSPPNFDVPGTFADIRP